MASIPYTNERSGFNYGADTVLDPVNVNGVVPLT